MDVFEDGDLVADVGSDPALPELQGGLGLGQVGLAGRQVGLVDALLGRPGPLLEAGLVARGQVFQDAQEIIVDLGALEGLLEGAHVDRDRPGLAFPAQNVADVGQGPGQLALHPAQKPGPGQELPRRRADLGRGLEPNPGPGVADDVRVAAGGHHFIGDVGQGGDDLLRHVRNEGRRDDRPGQAGRPDDGEQDGQADEDDQE